MGCYGFLKFMMFAFNGIIFLAGACILGVGIWVKVDSNSIFGLLEKVQDAPSEISQVLNVGYLLIAVGAVLVLLGFLGCCGAIRESKCMLLMFFIIVLLVFIAEVAGAVVILVFKSALTEVIEKVRTGAVKTIREEYGKNNDITNLWNSTMNLLKCCGFDNYTDFEDSPFVNKWHRYPTQCCHSTNTTCDDKTVTLAVIPGCYNKLESYINEHAIVIIGVALGIAALEIAAMAVSMSLYCHIDRKHSVN